VIKLERQLQAMKAQLAAAPAAASGTASVTNPAYLDLQIQLAGIDTELKLTNDELAATEEKRNSINERILKGPIVERDYVALRRDYEATLRRYLDVRSKQSDAELASNLETDRVGETLQLAEPPVEPVAPLSPNRRLMLAIGVLAAIAGAGVAGFVWDAFDGRVHGWRQVLAISGQTPFVIVPVIRTVGDRRRGRAMVAAAVVLVILIGASALFYVHQVLMPLDDFGLTKEAGASPAPLAKP
jgi:hypothetical protein